MPSAMTRRAKSDHFSGASGLRSINAAYARRARSVAARSSATRIS